MGDIGQVRAVSLSEVFPGGAVEESMFEGFIVFFTRGAEGVLVAFIVRRLGRKVADSSSHLMEPGGLEFTKAHEGVRFLWDGKFVGGVGEKVSPFLAELGEEEIMSLKGGESVFSEVGGVLLWGQSGFEIAWHKEFCV